MAPQRIGDGRDHRAVEDKRRQQAADPDSGLIDGDPDMVQDAIHKERDWFASAGIEVSGGDGSQKPAQHLLPSICLTSPRVSDGRLSPDRTRL